MIVLIKSLFCWSINQISILITFPYVIIKPQPYGHIRRDPIEIPSSKAPHVIIDLSYRAQTLSIFSASASFYWYTNHQINYKRVVFGHVCPFHFNHLFLVQMLYNRLNKVLSKMLDLGHWTCKFIKVRALASMSV